jgi:hypothetical protein
VYFVYAVARQGRKPKSSLVPKKYALMGDLMGDLMDSIERAVLCSLTRCVLRSAPQGRARGGVWFPANARPAGTLPTAAVSVHWRCHCHHLPVRPPAAAAPSRGACAPALPLPCWHTIHEAPAAAAVCATPRIYWEHRLWAWVPLEAAPAALGPSRAPWGIPGGRGGHILAFWISEHYNPAGRPNERGPLFFKPPPCASYSSSDRS